MLKAGWIPYTGYPARFLLLAFALGIRPALCQAENTYLASLLQEAHRQHLADERQWHLLLHVRRDLSGRLRSEIDDPSFFLSSVGRRDPAAELDATLQAFFEPASTDAEQQHPQCRYPARYAWLKEKLHFDARLPAPGESLGTGTPPWKNKVGVPAGQAGLPEQSCPRFDHWRDQMNAESVTVVFASYYLNNPASMYGHTFLRLNGRKHSEQERLLDYTANYMADVTTHNGFLFALYGLTGGYRGRFSTMPYYMKVQEYNNMESRDLWEYALRLDEKAVDRLVRHLWELGQTSLAYFFLNKNCSYQLLPVLEVAAPDYALSQGFFLKTVPADTLRTLRQSGLVTKVELRPSHVHKMLEARSRLTFSEIKAAEDLAEAAEGRALERLGHFTPDRQAAVLDSAYDLFRYRHGFQRDQPEWVQKQERTLLLLRNHLGRASPHPLPKGEGGQRPGEAKKEFSPDHGHKTGRVGLGFGLAKHSTFEEFFVRPALHDQSDDPSGYVSGSQLQMFNLRLRCDNDRKTAYLKEFTLIDLESLSPWDSWVHAPSWRVKTGLAVADDLDRDPENALYYGLNAGSGISFHSHLWKREIVYALAETDLGVGHPFQDVYRWGGGGTSGLMVDVTRGWRIHFRAGWLHYPLGDVSSATRLQLVQSFSLGSDWQLRATVERQNAYKEALLTVNLYW